MRPHVELIQENDYVWHSAELVGGEGRASERRLSVDEEDGSSSLRVDFHTDWGRGPGIHHANTEYYVVEGSMTYGGKEIGKGGYVYAPKGVPTDSITFSEGTRILHYREYGDAGFDPVDSLYAPSWADAREEVIVVDTEARTWDAVPVQGPMPGLFIKYLHVDPITGFYTRLVHSQEGWTEHRLAHHPCYEEAYTLQGRMEGNFGTMDVGTYFFRPARVKHGHFTTPEGGTTWLLRSDGELINWYTQNEWIRWGGEAVNYGPGGGRMRWSMSSHDVGRGTPLRDERDLKDIQASIEFQREQGQPDAGFVSHGTGVDKSLIAIAKAVDAADLQGGHGHGPGGGHEHDHDHGQADWGADPRDLEHPDERTDEHSHNVGRGRAWKEGQPIPAPIPSTLPVRSRSTGRWSGDGM
ncbi:DUF4437 domain-containing protein [Actinomadura barringtoniae]|uniref:DUF4437 domain-containing protein n=1 Tax=Actinomadura barringtoniae TaxID=1427535 RepID=A0A939T492_9ACTN|nr:DUF4437 domain-containing protein [Actinomadura barringtoniae]MBO2447879.1 DUF4437 domain-containing protein [Actinomadura barringtoniae]